MMADDDLILYLIYKIRYQRTKLITDFFLEIENNEK